MNITFERIPGMVVHELSSDLTTAFGKYILINITFKRFVYLHIIPVAINKTREKYDILFQSACIFLSQ